MIILNIGIIGSGTIAESFIAAVKLIRGAKTTAIYSRDKNSERVKELMEKSGARLAYDSLDEMFGNNDIDFIYIASPNSLHYAQSLKALEANKNVICEKPFTSTHKEAQHLLDVAKKKGLMIFEAIVTLHLPNFQIIKDNLYRLGQLRIVQLNFSQYSKKYDMFLAGQAPNVFNPEFSGGCLQDINIYNVHFMISLFGMPDKYEYFPNIHENGIDTSGIMIMQYAGFTAALTGSKDTRCDNFVYIQGEKGFIHVKGSSSTCPEIIVDISGQKPVTLNLQYEQSALYYELEVFKTIYDSKNFKRCYELARYSADIVNFVESARLKAGVCFAADKA